MATKKGKKKRENSIGIKGNQSMHSFKPLTLYVISMGRSDDERIVNMNETIEPVKASIARNLQSIKVVSSCTASPYHSRHVTT